MSDDYTYSERSYDDHPFTKPETVFINEDLIPFYNNMIDRYSPSAIVLVIIGVCSSLKELESTAIQNPIKSIKACLMCTDSGTVHDVWQPQPRYSSMAV